MLGSGRRFGQGLGVRGSGYPGNFGIDAPQPQDEAQTLKLQASSLQKELDAIQKRLAELADG